MTRSLPFLRGPRLRTVLIVIGLLVAASGASVLVYFAGPWSRPGPSEIAGPGNGSGTPAGGAGDSGSPGGGTDGSGDAGTQITATATYGPLGPVDVPLDLAASVVESALHSNGLAPTVELSGWPFDVRFSSGAPVSRVTLYVGGAVVDGERRDSTAFQYALTQGIWPLINEAPNFSAALKTAGPGLLLQRDCPDRQVSLDAEELATLAAMLDELEPASPDYGACAYPDYEIRLQWPGEWASAHIGWIGQETGREYLALSIDGPFTWLTWNDPSASVWAECASLLPPLPPEQREGLSKLFEATTVRAAGGSLGQPITCDAAKAPILVRLLRRGELSSAQAPSTETPISVVFSDAQHEWQVDLYQDCFTFEGGCFRLDGVRETFLRTMCAG